MKIAVAVLSIFLATSQLWAAPRYPFPRNIAYPHGGVVTTSDSESIQDAYSDWLSNQYVENGNEARVAFDDANYTVSEGIGYGMLIFVYMDNSQNNTQSKFDKLWAYYKNRRNGNGLMNWKIQGFNTGCDGTNCNGATDADLDVTLALLMAHKQWGNQTYLTDAKSLIDAIRKNELDGSNLYKPGDAWNDYKNPSYFSAATTELFKQVDASNASTWNSAITANYGLLKKNTAMSSAGLPSDWCSSDGSPISGKSVPYFFYDAVRVPWRLAIDYAWFGRADANTINSKMTDWASSTTSPIKGYAPYIKDGYNLDGSVAAKASGNVATFVGAFGTAALSSDLTWAAKCYRQLKSGAAYDRYYHRCLKTLYMLLMSGNFNNFWDTTSPTAIGQKGIALQANQFSVRQIGTRLGISGPDARLDVQLVDLSGRVQRTVSGKSELSMDVSGLSQGAYVLRFVAPEASLARTVVLTGR
jgi:endo-1,4-beta-D-glucanase Y